jgi:hypothetical protein
MSGTLNMPRQLADAKGTARHVALETWMKAASVMGLVCAAATGVAVLGGAPEILDQSGKDGPVDVDVVLRVSRKLVNDLTTQKVQRTTPISLCVLDTPMTGQARTEATSSILFDVQPEVSAFVVQLRGSSVSETVVDRPPIQVFGSGRIDFTLRKRVTFDGLKFRSKPSTIAACFSSRIDGIATPPGLFGLLVEFIATPKIRREEPIYAQAGFEDGKTQLIAAFDEEVDKTLDDLNQVSPLEKTVNTLFPETKDWIYYPRTTPTHLLIGIGPPQRGIPELPITEKNDAPIEVWIRSKPETQGMIFVLKLWKDANKSLEEMLPARLGKSLPLGEGFKTLTVKGWFVIQIGKGALKESPQEMASSVSAFAWGIRQAPPSSNNQGRVQFAQDRLSEPDVPPAPVVWRPMQRADAADQDAPIVWRPVTNRVPTLKAAPLNGPSNPKD